jgi:hypothetical protein
LIDRESTLEDVCFAVAAVLAKNGITAVLTGGSAATIYAPAAYGSLDADFVLDRDEGLAQIAVAVYEIGYVRMKTSRIFTHPESTFTLDFPKGPLAVGGDYVTKTVVLKRGEQRLRILSRTDCVRDRLAHYYHWDDYTALSAAVGVAAADPHDVDFKVLQEWTRRESALLIEKYHEFEERLKYKLGEAKTP